jgi:hypothetical protein
LLGVLQLINNKLDQPFSPMAEEGATELAQTLAVAFLQRRNAPFVARSRYDHLVGDGVLGASELELAQQNARSTGQGLEEVLIREFKVKPAEIGAALAKYFGVAYEPLRPDRIKPGDLLRNIKREYVDENHWLPLEETQEGLIVMAPDPEKLRLSRVVENIFPKRKLVYRVTTQREFASTVD